MSVDLDPGALAARPLALDYLYPPPASHCAGVTVAVDAIVRLLGETGAERGVV